MPEACYIHIPFCSGRKCKYCDFVSFTDLEAVGEYVESLLKEIDKNYKGENLRTLYFGGGTPSLVPPELLEKIVNKFSLFEGAELTLEFNPENGSFKYLESIKNIGINRLSIGSQTFNDRLLNLIGRRHNSSQIIETVTSAKKAGFKNISLDLIYGLPTQTIQDIKKDLEIFLSLDIQHISTYGLKIEGDSYWGKNPPEKVPDEDMQADMYEFINKYLEQAGFYRYEVSNFAKKGFESRHNLTYWNNAEYYGFGVSAHGYISGTRYVNFCTLKDYIKNEQKREHKKCLTQKEKLEEEIFLGFRKAEGINTDKILKKYNVNFEEKYKPILEKYSDFIIKTADGYAFNLQGTMLSNEILPEFLDNK